MIQLATACDVRREVAKRQRAYSGRGFGPRSFECLGIGIGLAVGGAPHAGPSSFDFGALAGSNGLTVRAYFRTDMGVSGTTGAGSTTITNQNGSAGAITAAATACTDGIGTIGTGLGGKQSLIANGSSQGGAFTMPTQVAPATTPFHKYWIARLIAVPGSPSGFLSGNAGSVVYLSSGPIYNQYNSGAVSTVAGTVTGQWYRGWASFTGSASDAMRVGAHTSSGGAGPNTAPTQTLRGVMCNPDGTGKNNAEWLIYMEVEGSLSAFQAFTAAADPKTLTEWSSAIET